MKDLKGTKTEKNLLSAFAGESQARNRYTYFAGQARKDGYMQIADIFEETANQEKSTPNGSSPSCRVGTWRSCRLFRQASSAPRWTI